MKWLSWNNLKAVLNLFARSTSGLSVRRILSALVLWLILDKIQASGLVQVITWTLYAIWHNNMLRTAMLSFACGVATLWKLGGVADVLRKLVENALERSRLITLEMKQSIQRKDKINDAKAAKTQAEAAKVLAEADEKRAAAAEKRAVADEKRATAAEKRAAAAEKRAAAAEKRANAKAVRLKSGIGQPKSRNAPRDPHDNLTPEKAGKPRRTKSNKNADRCPGSGLCGN